ncbi:MAG: NUDIX domain-containing protein [Bacteroidales bacterium]|nr:NUDIX domain-containing protein [Bacteroidales bacterium]
MVQIFYQQQSLILCHPTELEHIGPDDVCRFGQDLQDLGPLPAFFEAHPKIQRLYIPTEDPIKTLAAITALHKEVHAAGGLVQNPTGAYLMIYRNGCWDLPKGKHEAGESIEETAVREVEEECGLTQVQRKEKICTTYHTYEMFGETCLKATHWYAMDYTGQEEPQPQTEEGITHIEWVHEAALAERLTNTYPSIREVFVQAGLVQ